VSILKRNTGGAATPFGNKRNPIFVNSEGCLSFKDLLQDAANETS
jgi:hypothetical protein